MDFEMADGEYDMANLLDLFANVTTDFKEYDNSLSVVERNLHRVLPPFVLIIGVPGNILTLMTMNILSSEAFPLCGYLILISILDTTMLFLETGNNWISEISETDILSGVITSSDTLCKLSNFGKSLIIHHAVWILVSFAVECHVLLVYPKKIQHITSRRILDTLAFISVMLICANCHFFWTYGVDQVEFPIGNQIIKQHFCRFQTRSLDGQLIPGDQTTGFLWKTIGLVLATILPALVFLTLLVLNVRWKGLHKRESLKQKLTEYIFEKQTKNRENQKNGLPYDRHGVQFNSRYITRMLYYTVPFLELLFLFCHLPDAIHDTLERTLQGNPNIWSLTGVIFFNLKGVCHSCKIFVYLGTSQVFRRTLFELLRRKWNYLRHACALPSKKADDHIPSVCRLYQQEEESSPKRPYRRVLEV